MEEQYTPMKCSNSKSGCLIGSIIIAIALAIIVGIMVFLNHNKIAEIVTPEKDYVSQDTTHVVTPVLTVQDFLQFRYDIRESQRVDSMFMSLPDAVLVDILMTHGTSLSNTDIVRIYESNKERYSDIKTGADIQKGLSFSTDSQKIYTPILP